MDKRGGIYYIVPATHNQISFSMKRALAYCNLILENSVAFRTHIVHLQDPKAYFGIIEKGVSLKCLFESLNYFTEAF